MQRLVLFGKGGSGKTTIAAGLSAIWSLAGRRVLHVGCDPKRDSLFCLVDRLPETTALERLLDGTPPADPAEILVRGRLGMDCVDSGGIPPGLGCGGRGVMLVVEAVQRLGLLDDGRYDVALFDVLGDLVCGGFTAPLRPGVGEDVVVVLSDDLLSMFAANSICQAIAAYHDNGVRLAGFVLNEVGPRTDRDALERFATRLSADVLGAIPRSRWIGEAELDRRTVIEAHPRSAAAAALRALAERLDGLGGPERGDARVPTPMDELELVEFARRRRRAPRRGQRR